MKLCKHISLERSEKRYDVREPATIEPYDTDEGEKLRCSLCKKNLPIIKRDNGALRIRLIPKDYNGDGSEFRVTGIIQRR